MIGRLFFALLFIQTTLGQKHNHRAAQPSQPWLTLKGQRPVVVARGGYSGVYPEASDAANLLALQSSVPDVIIYCNLQQSKDGQGFCLSSFKLDNATNIGDVFPNGRKTYDVNGKQINGYLAVDYTAEQLYNVSLIQNIFSRPSVFDAMFFPISTVEQVLKLNPAPPGFWLNIEYSNFYAQHKLDPTLYVEEILRAPVGINYVSSPEIGFLKNLNGKVDKTKTKLVFKFLEEENAIEPTTNQTYTALLKNLSSVKSFASGILVPKELIWPVNAQMYLEEAPTTLVADAHKQGLEVYAYSFSNDHVASYNYSYDPSTEYVQFIDNSQFSVDGFLTDFPSTASEAIACFAHNKNASRPVKGTPLVITHNGASGVYPGCTDLAYQQAVDDGADIIDCSVQMSKDGVTFCLNTTDLASATTAKPIFLSRATTVPEIQSNNGIFSFDLTWDEIQTLKPQIATPFLSDFGLLRNPAYKNAGKFVTLAEFLEFSKQKKVPGIMITIKNAAYLASKKGLSITDVVATSLSNASFDKQSTQQVLIQSDDSAVLSRFSNVATYKRVLLVEEIVSDVPKSTVDEIKKVADAVTLRRSSIVRDTGTFTIANTGVVEELHKANISVYVSVFRNEFYTIAVDFFSDPIVEMATYVLSPIGVDGIVTEYPRTAASYLRSPCSNPNANLDYTVIPVLPGDLLNTLQGMPLPPAQAPAPALEVADVVDPPLPAVLVTDATASEAPTAAQPAPAPPASKSSQTANVANLGLSLIAVMVLSLVFIAC